jgi:hypothetical protein
MVRLTIFILSMVVLISFLSCENDVNIQQIDPIRFVQNDSLNLLFKDFKLMDEKAVSISKDSSILATYFNPVTRYKHGILGDAVEAGSLVVYINKKYLVFNLGELYVYEDIVPRLVDVDKDGLPEVICIRSHLEKGAGIVIYKIAKDSISEFAVVSEIGTPNRWLNIASIGDLNVDGNIELIWVQTPHIGGILKVAEVKKGQLEVLDQSTLYSSHAIGERNLCLSVVTKNDNKLLLHLPSHDRKQIVSLTYDGKFKEVGRIAKEVDFSKNLLMQYDFKNIVKSYNFCD